MSKKDTINYFGFTDFRNQKIKFGIKNEDRSRHVYIIGKTGMGKSTLLENMAAQDILNGEGMCFVDPHGSAIDVLIDYIPDHRVEDVVYFAPFDTEYPISFNVLEDVAPDKRHLVMAGLMASFKKIWPESFSERMTYILSNVLLALLEFPGATLLGVNRMLADKDYKDMVVEHVTDASVKAFWIDEYNKWDPRYAREAGAAIQNKIGQFTANPLIRNIVGQEKTSFDIRKMMDEKKILLVNLSKGQIGESNGNLLGGMLITKLYLAAMSRADVGVQNLKNLPNFFFFVDEFQNFANESFADILSEARKYKLNLTVAHQYIEQMEEKVASAIFGNVGTMITFRVGPTDAEVLEKQFAPTFTAEDIVNLGKFQVYLSLMIDGIGSRPFSAGTLPPIKTPGVSLKNEMIANSRYFYAQKRAVVEAEIEKWYEPVKKPIKKKIEVNPHLSQNKDKVSDMQIPITSKGSRDFTTPLKKTLKEIDEREAEIEMKKTVSPKLNMLLDKLSMTKTNTTPNTVKKVQDTHTPSQKIHTPSDTSLPKKQGYVVEQKKIPQPSSLKKNQEEPNNRTHPIKKNSRSTESATLSSLQSVLQKALNTQRQDTSLSSPQSHQPQTDTHTSQKKDTDIISSSTPKAPQNTQQKPDSVVSQNTTTPTKEIPEGILRNLLE